jgi:hypothetical protein
MGNAIAAADKPPLTSSQENQLTNQLTKSFSSAANAAEQYPKYAKQITAAAKSSFIDGADLAYTAGIIAILLGAVLVFFLFPRKNGEEELLAEYHEEDTAARAAKVGAGTGQ